jgi:hypothetical protein
MERISFVCIFPEIYEKRSRYPSNEDLFQALAQAIKSAEGSELVEVPIYKESWTQEEFHKRTLAVKFNLLALKGNFTITLTKKGRGVNPNIVQLRGWVRNPSFWEQGGHVDEYDNGAIFEAWGPFEIMKSLTHKFLAQGRRCFEDEHYVVWL